MIRTGWVSYPGGVWEARVDEPASDGTYFVVLYRACDLDDARRNAWEVEGSFRYTPGATTLEYIGGRRIPLAILASLAWQVGEALASSAIRSPSEQLMRGPS